jgi:hypothetical protein
MFKWAGPLFLLSQLGCSSSGAQPANAPQTKAGPGKSADDPVMTCGPQDSYAYVASRFRCADGSNPFAGDAKRAAASRRGSEQSPASNHLVDSYEVPCASGPEIVYVDLYGCPEEARKLDPLDPVAEAVTDHFSRGEFETVLKECQALREDATHDARGWCAALVPASLYALNRDSDGLSSLSSLCQRMAPSSPHNEGRASVIAVVMGALAEAHGNGHLQRNQEQLNALLASFLQACQVSEEDLKRVVDKMREGA